MQDRNERRKRGLGEPKRMAKLEDEAARANTYIGDDADWIDFKTTVCTAPDQIALAPGYLQKEYDRKRPALLQLRDGPADAELLRLSFGATGRSRKACTRTSRSRSITTRNTLTTSTG